MKRRLLFPEAKLGIGELDSLPEARGYKRLDDGDCSSSVL